MFVLFISVSVRSQFVAPKIKETVKVTMNLLQPIDTFFIERLTQTLYSTNKYTKDEIAKCIEKYKLFNVTISKCDSNDVEVYVSLYETPMRNGDGCLKKNGYLYIFKGDIASLFIQTKRQRNFTYTEYFGIIDLPEWRLIYNKRKKEFKIVDFSFN